MTKCQPRTRTQLKTTLGHTLKITVMLFLACTSRSYAFNFTATDIEFMGSTEICKRALTGKVNNEALKQQYLRDNPWKDLIWKVGGWHYCGGAIKVKRAEITFASHEQEQLFKSAIGDIHYSYSRIDKKHPWAVDMAVTLAQAYKGLDQWSKAYKTLDDILAVHPNNSKALTMYGLTYYKQGNYTEALSYLEKANNAAGGNSAEIVYFMGLAAFKSGKIALAKQYADRAMHMGYPLLGLKNMLKRSGNQ